MAEPYLSEKPAPMSGFGAQQTDALAHWYAARTLPRHEKVVAEHLGRFPFESYLPLYQAERNWKGRRAEILLPLFPGYVFVKTNLTGRVQVLRHPSVSGLVCFNGKPAPLPEEEIEHLRQWLASRSAEPYPFMVEGKRVRVKAGPLAGMEGVIVRRKGKNRLVVTIDALERSIAFEVDTFEMELAV
jgi:transcription termination/antitermination protein NusG